MPWFEVSIAIDSEVVRVYAVFEATEEDAAFLARDWFDDLVSVETSRSRKKAIKEDRFDHVLVKRADLSEPDVKGVGRRAE